MSSEKLVRCEIERTDGSSPGVRFVPLDIVGLWEQVMASRHDFRIKKRAASVWVEMDEAAAAGSPRIPVERVTEISLFVFDPHEGMLQCVCRYVPTVEMEKVRPVLIGHYAHPTGAQGPLPWLRERHGIWYRPRAEVLAGAEPVNAGTHR
jgi:hypothetical protein